ncbi:MAG: AMMECR1 domain-containing protein [Spirochaetota bacterium]
MLVTIVVVCPPVASHPGDDLESWSTIRGSTEEKCLFHWLRQKGTGYLRDQGGNEHFSCALPEFYGRFGLFITLVYNGRVRGCYGAFHHATDNVESILGDYLKGALTRDNRHRPLEAHEFEKSSIILTVASGLYPVVSLETLDISRFGIKAHCGDGSILVIVPSEIKSIEYLKKILSPYDVVQLFAFRCVTLRGEP